MFLFKRLISKIFGNLTDLDSQKMLEKYRLMSKGNGRKNYKMIKELHEIIYIKPDFPMIKKMVRKL